MHKTKWLLPLLITEIPFPTHTSIPMYTHMYTYTYKANLKYNL